MMTKIVLIYSVSTMVIMRVVNNDNTKKQKQKERKNREKMTNNTNHPSFKMRKQNSPFSIKETNANRLQDLTLSSTARQHKQADWSLIRFP